MFVGLRQAQQQELMPRLSSGSATRVPRLSPLAQAEGIRLTPGNGVESVLSRAPKTPVTALAVRRGLQSRRATHSRRLTHPAPDQKLTPETVTAASAT
jgi:hypothetical protein